MAKFYAKSKKGNLNLLTDRNREGLKKDLAENDGARYTIERITPESIEQRGFYHGAVLRLWAYLNELNYKDHNVIENMHKWAKEEFNGEMVIVDGKQKVFGKSTKGKLNGGYIDRIVDHLEEQYAIDRKEVLDPENYKQWRYKLQPEEGGPDDYIDYLISVGRLRRPEVKKLSTE